MLFLLIKKGYIFKISEKNFKEAVVVLVCELNSVSSVCGVCVSNACGQIVRYFQLLKFLKAILCLIPDISKMPSQILLLFLFSY